MKSEGELNVMSTNLSVEVTLLRFGFWRFSWLMQVRCNLKLIDGVCKTSEVSMFLNLVVT